MRPFVFVNLAMSADGKLSTRERRQVKISGPSDFRRVDEIKAGSDAIMVGIGTVLADDPSLTVKSEELCAQRRSEGKEEHPIRVVVDSHARTPPDADILHKGVGRRVIAVSEAAPEERVSLLRESAEVVTFGREHVDLSALLEYMGDTGVKRLMVEGGGTLIWSLFADDLVDELYTCIGNVVIGGKDAPTPADGEGFITEKDFPRLSLTGLESLDEGVLICWKVIR